MRKKSGDHCACLGDIVLNITKIGIFCSFSEGSLGQVIPCFAVHSSSVHEGKIIIIEIFHCSSLENIIQSN